MAAADVKSVPLCVDLDGTLIRSDLLVEGFLRVVKARPLQALMVVPWLLRGRAYLKQQVAARAKLDPATLPYNEPVIEWLRQQRAEGRPLVLCTAAHVSQATEVARHLALFDEVIASDGTVNLAGRRKGALLGERYGEQGFDYIGNEVRDLAIWRLARRAVVVSPDDRLARRGELKDRVERTFVPEPRPRATSWLRALRLHQWAKNALIFVPALVSHLIFQWPVLQAAVLAFLCFGLCASGNYVINDLLDLDADRVHPHKRLRPFASGELPLAAGIVAAGLLLVTGIGGAFWLLGPAFGGVLLAYLVGTFWYSWTLKRIAMVDVLALAGLYTVRVVAGAAAIGVAPSFWLLAYSMFLFLSLALVKRYCELKVNLEAGKTGAAGRGYNTDDLPLLLSAGTSAGLISVLVLALYVHDASEGLYSRPYLLWLICPLLLYWVVRVWRKAHRGELEHDPVVFALRDRPSLAVFAACVILMFFAI